MSTTPTPIIEVHDLVKTFGKARALDGLNLQVLPGQVHGFLGPNGAGKSTTLHVLLGLLRADSGTARVLGYNPWTQAPKLHRHLAYVPGDVSLWPNLTGGEAIDLLGRARGGLDLRRRNELIDLFDLDPRKKARAYSKGNRQKVALIAALAAPVDLFLLDEPTSGLDPLMEHHFTTVVADLKAQGRTVLLSSHILSEVEALCDHVTLIKDGRAVQSGSLDSLRSMHEVKVTASLGKPARPAQLELPGVREVRVDGAEVSAQVSPEALDVFLATLSEHAVHALTANPPTLEELFLSEYEAQK